MHRTTLDHLNQRLHHQALEHLHEATPAADLEVFLAALLLRSAPLLTEKLRAWSETWIEDLLEREPPASVERARPHDVALVGARLALGAMGDDARWFIGRAQRELARPSSDRIPSVHDDERLLLGIAAGVGAVAPQLAEQAEAVVTEWKERERGLERVVGQWANCLAHSTGWNVDLNLESRLVSATGSVQGWFRDGLAALWLLCRQTTAAATGKTERATFPPDFEHRRVQVYTRVMATEAWSVLDAAMLLEVTDSWEASHREQVTEGGIPMDLEGLGEPAPEARRALLELLCRLSTRGGFEPFIRSLPDAEKLLWAIPPAESPPEVRCDALLDAVLRFGKVDTTFFVALYRTAPGLADDIRGVAVLWKEASAPMTSRP